MVFGASFAEASVGEAVNPFMFVTSTIQITPITHA
jgi:hypothetical protein